MSRNADSTKKREFHPIAEIFPLMVGDDLQALADDIRENGLREVIVCHEDGRILDGRNRYLACEIAGVEPQFGTREDDGFLAAWVVSKNLHRRHLSDAQRAMIAAKIATRPVGHNKHYQYVNEGCGPNGPPSAETAATLLNVSPKTVKRARKVVKKGSKPLINAVETGKISISAAAQIADLPKAEQRALMKQDHEAVIEASRPEDHKVNPSQLLGSRAMIEANWLAATDDDKKWFSAKYGAKAQLQTLAETSALPVTKLSRAEMLGVIDRFRRQATDGKAVQFCDWAIKVAFAITGGAAAETAAKPNGGIDRFGRSHAALGSLLKDKGPSGKNGAIEKR